jgi:hypothetical protein
VTTGLVQTAHYPRRRRREFVDFMNEIVAAHAGREIHVVLDNLSAHKPKEDRWLKTPSPGPLPLPPDLLVLAESGRVLVQHSQPASPPRRQFFFDAPASPRDRQLCRGIQPERSTLRMEESGRLPIPTSQVL